MYNNNMEEKTSGKFNMLQCAPIRLAISLLSAILIAVAYALRRNGDGMVWVFYRIARPYHIFMSRLCSYIDFSAAELFYAAALLFLIIFIICRITAIVRAQRKWCEVYMTVITLVMICLLFWAGYSYLWTPYYYAPTFSEQSGISDGGITDDELETVTAYFAERADKASQQVQRDSNGIFYTDRDTVLNKAPDIYGNIAQKWEFLNGEKIRPKGIVFSKIMSYTDFTGFFFPITGEANVNMDSPSVMLASTAEHEISHQRGIGKEQECNFLAIAACMESGDADFEYSGALLAYIYLGNALYKVDRDAWKTIRENLNEQVIADLENNTEYWNGFETIVQKFSNTAYESFLKGNGQTLGLKSYGACVNLLVNYYYPIAKTDMG